MEQRAEIRLMLAHECPICKQLIDSESEHDGRLQKKLGFVTGWASCPSCFQEVRPPYLQGYKRRFVRFCQKNNIKAKGST